MELTVFGDFGTSGKDGYGHMLHDCKHGNETGTWKAVID